jgi:hypothetical protein
VELRLKISVRVGFCIIFATASLASCDNNSPQLVDNGAQPSLSHEPLDPGSYALPSNGVSRRLFEMDGQARLEILREYMNRSGKDCDEVTEAVLRGGYQHVDFWRVACSDSGEWEVAIEPDEEGSTRILSCKVVKELARLEKRPSDDCHAPWDPPKRKPHHAR